MTGGQVVTVTIFVARPLAVYDCGARQQFTKAHSLYWQFTSNDLPQFAYEPSLSNHSTQLGTVFRDVSRPFTIRAKYEVTGCDRHFAFQNTHNRSHIAFPRHFGSNNLVSD